MELARAGVNYRANNDANWPMAMKLELPRFLCFPWFWCKPTMLMPKLHVHDSTELVLRNLILYEQSSLVPEYGTSYMWAMDMLLDSPEDVAKLVKIRGPSQPLWLQRESCKYNKQYMPRCVLRSFLLPSRVGRSGYLLQELLDQCRCSIEA
uniref:Uncharacterized protein n=1 Tax=Lactuca sativa TaxID=4236 RepID=A0A9R1WA69_LACSA|nr:hypothetical protein LSAT_V11C200060810 [Lactuca sativa]